jgi:hypothetical protein
MFSDTPTMFNEIGSARALNISPAATVPQIGVFRKEREYWTVVVGGNAVRLKDSKGLTYLAYMLRHPAAEFHVLDLAGGIAGRDQQEANRLELSQESLEKAGIHIGNLGDAGELLDDQAKNAYRQRLAELREELEEAKALGKVERADQLEQEIDALTRELSRAVGLGGRRRRAASASERARQTVTKAIRAAMERIARSNAKLGNIFSRCIKTGTFCSYRPDPNLLTRWEFAAIDIEPRPISTQKVAPAGLDYMQSPSAMLGILPFSIAQRTPFVDREDESQVIRAAVEQARNGSGSLVMLTGGPGVGKTRLATEMEEYAARNGFACLLGGCYERDEPFPFLPFVQIIETMLAQAPSPDEFRRQIGDNAPELAELVPSLRRIFPDIPDQWNCQILKSDATFCRALHRHWGMLLEDARTC